MDEVLRDPGYEVVRMKPRQEGGPDEISGRSEEMPEGNYDDELNTSIHGDSSFCKRLFGTR